MGQERGKDCTALAVPLGTRPHHPGDGAYCHHGRNSSSSHGGNGNDVRTVRDNDRRRNNRRRNSH